MRRTATQAAKLLATAGLVVATSAVLPANAHADDGDASGAAFAEPATADFALDPGETVTYESSEIEDIRESDAAEDVFSPTEIAEAQQELVDESADRGVFLEPEDVDVIPLLDGDASLALDREQVVEDVTLERTDEGSLEVSVQTAERTPTDTALAGPGMAAYWTKNGGGTYTIKIYVDFNLDGRGSLLYASGVFTWDRWKLSNDGDPTYKDWYRYQRFGDFQPESISYVQDAKVERLRIQSFPFDSIEPYLRNWERFSPGADRGDNCNTYTATAAFKGIEISVPFSEGCGVYNMWRNVDKPSSYWIQYEDDNGAGGNHEVAFLMIWAQKQGTAGSLHDLNLIKTLLPSECQQTDASRTCSW